MPETVTDTAGTGTAGPIRWPQRFNQPEKLVCVANTREIATLPVSIWACLVQAASWPEWYGNAHAVQIEGGGIDLFPGARFRWRTFSVGLVSDVVEFEPFERIAWTGEGFGVSVYHAWLITPTARGSLVRTEERQKGVLAHVCNALFPRRMHEGHCRWLQALENRALAYTECATPSLGEIGMPSPSQAGCSNVLS